MCKQCRGLDFIDTAVAERNKKVATLRLEYAEIIKSYKNYKKLYREIMDLWLKEQMGLEDLFEIEYVGRCKDKNEYNHG